MSEKTMICPSCQGQFQVASDKETFFCPYCGTKIVRKQEPAQTSQPSSPSLVNCAFTDATNGVRVGSAAVSEGWRISGSYQNVKIDEITPFGTGASAASPDGEILIGTSYGEHWYHFLLNGPLQNAYPRSQWKKYQEPEDYLRTLAETVVKAKVTPLSTGPVNTMYDRNREQELNKRISRFEENAHITLPSIRINLKLQNTLCMSQAIIASYESAGRSMVIIMAADLFGLEIYDSAAMGALNRGMTKGLKTLVGLNRKKKTNVEPGAFGHAYEEGKAVDMIEWGCKRRYYGIAPEERKKEMIPLFMKFAETWQQDPILEQQLVNAHRQVVAQEQATLNNAVNYARQSQMDQIRRTQDISRTLNQTSDIVMQGWENKMASDSRISDQWSQAIRGVNTYSTTDGRTVEHSVVSDHVYQTEYGDTVGVSGTLNDVPAGWTELERKD